MRNNLLVLAALSALTAHAGAQDATRLRSQVRDYVRTNDVAIVRELSEFWPSRISPPIPSTSGEMPAT
jgi:hypothetical protein